LLEAILMNPQIGLKVFIEYPVEVGAFRMSRSIDRGPIGDHGGFFGRTTGGSAAQVQRFPESVRTACGIGRHCGA
jgi:hypothetical protein